MSWLRASAATLLVAATLIGGAQAQGIVAFVNGAPITAQDVEQRSQLLEAPSPTHMPPSRQEIVEMPIDEKILAPEARRRGIGPSDQRFIDILRSYLPELRRAASIEHK